MRPLFLKTIIITLTSLLIIFHQISFASNKIPTKEQIIKKAVQKKLWTKDIWKILLHYNPSRKRSYIEDSKFILTAKDFNLKSELIKTIISFFDDPKKYNDINNHPICKFPARFLFIKKELNLKNISWPQVYCKDFEEYKNKAPADQISLIFASENIKKPASVMGHLFLEFEGENYQNKHVEHAISFFTIINTYNPFKLFAESLLFGMQGLFALRPFRTELIRYLEIENRNIWKYPLRLDNYQKKLIYYHVWELKDVKMKYYFQKYNCATVIYYILALSRPQMLHKHNLWVTPRDVVKEAYKENLIKNGKLLPSDQWLIRMLQENINFSDKFFIKRTIKQKKFYKLKKFEEGNKQNFYKLKVAEVYGYYLFKKRRIAKQDYLNLEKVLMDIYKNFPNYKINISNYKSPIKTPQDSQIIFGFKHLNHDGYIKIGFLPASHLLNDNNREYFTESALALGKIGILFNRKRLKLEEFKIYKTESLIPFDLFTGGISSNFEFGIGEYYDNKLKEISIPYLNFGLGLSFKPTTDILFAILVNSNSGYIHRTFFLYPCPQVLLMIYEVFDMKTIFSFETPISLRNFHKKFSKLSIEQMFYIKEHYKFFINYTETQNKYLKSNSYVVGLAIYF